MPRLVCLSDTHDRLEDIEVPEGDVLIHAGDFSRRGKESQVQRFAEAFGSLPHPHKLLIAGNHDFLFERDPDRAREIVAPFTYLQDSGVECCGLRFWGAPWQPRFFDWAFNLDRGPEIAAKWALIPTGIDVLITHGPPQGVLDLTSGGEHAGCEELRLRIAELRPRLHVFGHIHEAWGRITIDGTTFVNASNCDLGYHPVQAAQVIDL